MSKIIGVRILWVSVILNGVSAFINAIRGDWGILFALCNFTAMCFCLIVINQIRPKTKA